MQGTVPRKIGRVLINLIQHPQYISRCLAHNVVNGKTPLDLEVPWFSYSAIDFLDTFLEPNMTVCEYGSGGSTVFFARRVQSVFSIEDNPKWHELVTNRLREKALRNVTMKLCPFDFKNPDGFETSDYLHAMPNEKFDVIVVDGSEEWAQVRPVCFRKAEAHINRGALSWLMIPGGIQRCAKNTMQRACEFSKALDRAGPVSRAQTYFSTKPSPPRSSTGQFQPTRNLPATGRQ